MGFGSDEWMSYWLNNGQSGILIMKLKANANKESTLQSTVTVSYEDSEECDYTNSKSVIFDEKEEEYFDSLSIRKAILLCKYCKLLMEWMEQTKSVDESLRVNQKYKKKFVKFRRHFENEMNISNDPTLQRELDVLIRLSS